MLSRTLLRIKVLQILYANYNSNESGIVKSEKNLEYSSLKAYELYHSLLLLPISLQKYHQKKIDLARKKRLPSEEDINPNMRFLENRFITQLAQNPTFNAFVSQQHISWNDNPELISKLYAAVLNSQYYKDYLESEDSYEADKKFVIDMLSTECPPPSPLPQPEDSTSPVVEIEEDPDAPKPYFEKEYHPTANFNHSSYNPTPPDPIYPDTPNTLLAEIMEDQSVFWNDDISFILPMVIHTVSNASPSRISIKSMYGDPDDQAFASTLVRATIANFDKNLELIDENLRNWNTERLALIDTLILQMAITELISFTSIPVKVTFDEYIEIARFYSTPESSAFINGVLDNIYQNLQKEGKINKAGRGLINE